MRNLALIGFMGCGKTTVGRRCARALSFRFRDSDTLVERWMGKPVSAVFAEDGEPRFRELERRAVEYLARQDAIVLATGGGAVMDPANVDMLRRTCVLAYLRLTPEEVLDRVGSADTRPLLAGHDDPVGRVRDLLARRDPVYLQAADVVVPTGGLDRAESARRVLEAYHACIGS